MCPFYFWLCSFLYFFFPMDNFTERNCYSVNSSNEPGSCVLLSNLGFIILKSAKYSVHPHTYPLITNLYAYNTHVKKQHNDSLLNLTLLT